MNIALQLGRTLAALITLVLVAPPGAQEDIIFEGTPHVRINADGRVPKLQTLTEREARGYACKIIRKNGKYLWASRENLELVLVEGGSYRTFVAPGSGYIKIWEPRSTAEAATMAQFGQATFHYLEHMSLGLQIVTYWGWRGNPNRPK